MNYGYFAGGGGGYPRQSTISRIDYANDSAATAPKGPLTQTSSGAAGQATGTANYGYFQLRSPSYNSIINRVDYANDTATATVKGSLVNSADYRRATGNTNYGYFIAGRESSTAYTYIDRINYNNDTVTASPKGNLTDPTSDMQAFSAHENGLSG